MVGSEAVAAWRKERTARQWIQDWLVGQCDYGMTIDMPLWVTSSAGAKSPFHRCTSKQLIGMTVQNLRLLDKFSPAETRWLNVVQGGVTYVDVMMMRDEGAFSAGQDWLHVLGVSTPLWAVILTEVQRALRRENSALTISFDSSSPFLLGGRFEQACLWPELTTHPSTWVIRSERAPQRPSYAKETCRHKFPYSESPLGSRLKLNELNVREGPWEPRQFDLLSNAMLMNHNTWIHLDAFRRANELVEANASERIPADHARCLEIVRQVMSAEDAVAATRVLEPHVKFLDALAPMSM
jgi:hypothetical protein